ncbi:uncharacterized protein SCHCODRAFT_02123674 [Schizophyllum commune H4-8]|uniref:uncharacterized protein n=1 Tax=Schizophyllum commune (strain H4-8 / FGSC 9210) TaxID=578458 RepID=UPI00215DFFDE|nr:uncharacterized protein SCHCODRAFT_02123674 [Schizophyllum commune H4-8]KAI5885271.1 hypothetical protein SCHCODRAFT_02123674 [Schizophyllum commune H4-8]
MQAHRLGIEVDELHARVQRDKIGFIVRQHPTRQKRSTNEAFPTTTKGQSFAPRQIIVKYTRRGNAFQTGNLRRSTGDVERFGQDVAQAEGLISAWASPLAGRCFIVGRAELVVKKELSSVSVLEIVSAERAGLPLSARPMREFAKRKQAQKYYFLVDRVVQSGKAMFSSD